MMYNQIVKITDSAPVVSKLVVGVGRKIDAQPIDAASFTVAVKRIDPRSDKPGHVIEAGGRKITAIYVSDAEGNKVDSGNFLALELAYGPDETLSSPMNYDNVRNIWIDYSCVITQKKTVAGVSGLSTEKLGKIYRPEIDRFNLKGKCVFTDPQYGKITLTYADYKPMGVHQGSALPLIIWVHGWGEGGTDASIPISANKACNFASPEIQRIFGGAYVLAPQSPTYWMDNGKENRDHDTANISKYTAALKNLIDTYITENPGVDKRRIYVGGCSNGGFMTQVLIMAYPALFAAAFPVCSAALDSRITDKDIKGILKLPVWFINAASDPAVFAPEHSLATYARMVKMGAPHVYYSFPRDVRDTSGLYKNRDGSPHEYSGHCSWIYVYNNDIRQCIGGKEISLMEWLALQHRK